jgi:hypothetical protein
MDLSAEIRIVNIFIHYGCMIIASNLLKEHAMNQDADLIMKPWAFS